MHRYTALIDGEAGAYGVSFPDLPGCVAMGRTVDEAMLGAAEALWEFNVDVTASGGTMPAPRAPERLREDSEVAKALSEGASLASVPATHSHHVSPDGPAADPRDRLRSRPI